jgi:predicted nucleic acid-binding protein
MLVLDASAVNHACTSVSGFAPFGREGLVAPPILWSEFRSSLHESVWRGEVPREQAGIVLERFAASRIERREPRNLGPRAWEIADLLGWAKTYDAEYVALADILGCRLVTQDARMLRGAARLGFVIAVADL